MICIHDYRVRNAFPFPFVEAVSMCVKSPDRVSTHPTSETDHSCYNTVQSSAQYPHLLRVP